MRNCYDQSPPCSFNFIPALIALLMLLPLTPLQGQTPYQKGYDDSYNRENGYGMAPDGTSLIFAGSIDSPGDAADMLLARSDPNYMVSGVARIAETGVSQAEWAYDLKAAPQGAYVLAGARRNPNNLVNGLLVQTTTSGGIQWCNAYPNGNLNSAYHAVAEVSTYGYVAAGYTGNNLSSGANTDMLLTIVSNNTGSVQCGSAFGGNGNESANDVIRLSNGNYLAVGYTESFGAQGKAFYLMVIDSNCNKVWSRVVDGPDDEIAYAAAEDNFGIVVVGQSKSYNTSSRWNVMMSRFNFSGLHLATNIYENSNYQDGARGIAYLGLADGYLISGRTLEQDSIAWLMKITPNFSVAWYRQYEGIVLQDVLGNTSTGGIAVGSHLAPGLSTNDFFVVNTDAMGNTGSTCNPLSLTPTSTVVQPAATSGLDTALVVNSMSSLGCSSTPLTLSDYDACTFVGIPPGLPGRVLIRPNPSAGATAVDFAFDGLRETRIELYDLQGRSLLQMELGQTDRGIVPLDLSTMPAGTYLLRIRADKEVWSRKIVKE